MSSCLLTGHNYIDASHSPAATGLNLVLKGLVEPIRSWLTELVAVDLEDVVGCSD